MSLTLAAIVSVVEVVVKYLVADKGVEVVSQKVLGKVGEAGGNAINEAGKQAFNSIKQALTKRSEVAKKANNALTNVEEDPNDEDYQRKLATELEKLAVNDTELYTLLEYLSTMVQQVQTGISGNLHGVVDISDQGKIIGTAVGVNIGTIGGGTYHVNDKDVENATNSPFAANEARSAGKDSNKVNQLPDVSAYTLLETYILAIDTVDFSSQTDDLQLQIFLDLLNAVPVKRLMGQARSDNVVTLLTGDGLIIAFKGADSLHGPLNLALSMLNSSVKLRAYSLRFGINNGPVYWIKMVDGSRQLIGHAVNWAVRVMDAAKGNTILVSDVYYNQILRPTMDSFSVYRFQKMEGLVTKKKEEIAAYQVVVPQS